MLIMKFVRTHLQLPLLLAVVLVSPQLPASDGKDGEGSSEFKNIGFVEKPPKELTDTFPMCDAFLKVDWIDKEKKIGYSRYDIYNRFGKKEERPALALIHLDQDRPRFDYDLDEYEAQGQLETVFSRIRMGQIFFKTTFLTIRYGGESSVNDMDFRNVNGVRDIGGISFSDYRNTVCISYPDNERMWIAEGRRLDRVYDETQRAALINRVKIYVEDFERRSGKYSYIVDVNLDRKDDYAFEGMVVYSYGSAYYAMQMHESRDGYSDWAFPPSQRGCHMRLLAGTYLTTDGQNYFLNNQCNLTELTREGE